MPAVLEQVKQAHHKATPPPLPRNTARTSFTPLPAAKQRGEEYVPFPMGSEGGWTHAHARQTILAEPEELYQLWSKQTEFPRWQEHVLSVSMLDNRKSHWVMGDPEKGEASKRFEFDSELTEDIPGQKIAWKSVGGDIQQKGSVEFKRRADGRGTLVTLIQHFKVGAVANAIASVTARGVGQTVIENLRHFKELAETGEIPTVKNNPHGPRGVRGAFDQWMLGETNPTPPGTSNQAA